MGRAPLSEKAHRLFEVARVFTRLGCLSFGGPIAHLGYFRAELIEKRKWLDDAHFGELISLCQFLPGPASSQVVFAIGMHRAGLWGALIASLCFTLPSALLMIFFAHAVAGAVDLQQAGWLRGLLWVSVAVVAQAVWGMGKTLCPDLPRASMALASAAVLLFFPGTMAQWGVLAAGGIVGAWLFRTDSKAALSGERRPLGAPWALMSLVLFFLLLAVLPAAALATGNPELQVFDSFYRAGAMVFGGGHVVLPMLRAEVVPRGWLTDAQFLAGYGAAQAIPGPLFTFAGYLGAAMKSGPWGWPFGFFSLFAIFLPAWLLVFGALPFWQSVRKRHWVQAAMKGANASVVGVLLAALYQPVFTESVHTARDGAMVLLAFGLLEKWKVPAWAVVAAGAAVGQLLVADVLSLISG